jgi:hypothetical protein
MRIPTAEIPQANTFQSVLDAVDAVARGATTYQEIAESLGGLDERQGRYYRLAGEILGFLRNNHNRAVLTTAGESFVRAGAKERETLAAQAVLRARLIQRVIPYLESKGETGASQKGLENFLTAVTQPTTPAMIHRRASTVTRWLIAIGMVREKNDRFVLRHTLPEDVPAIEFEADDEPLVPERYELQTYEEVTARAKQTRGYLTVLVDEAARDRANDAHKMLTNLISKRIRAAGAIPRFNKYVDMSTHYDDAPYLFEMKSTKDGNAHDQVRKAISQLYEYRYLQGIPEARLVVVIENPLPKEKKWLVDYVVKDREMLIAWDGDDDVHYPDELRPQLHFLD